MQCQWVCYLIKLLTAWTLQKFQAALNPTFAGLLVNKNLQVKAQKKETLKRKKAVFALRLRHRLKQHQAHWQDWLSAYVSSHAACRASGAWPPGKRHEPNARLLRRHKLDAMLCKNMILAQTPTL